MEKVRKFNMLYQLVDTQGRDLVNIGILASSPTPTSVVRASAHMLEVDHHLGVAVILSVEEPTSPSTKSVRDERPQSPWGETSLKISCIS